MTMKPVVCSSLVSVLLFLLIPAVVARPSSSLDQTPDLIDQTCQKTPYPLLCSLRIRPDLRSIKAKGPADLGIIMSDQVNINAQTAITKINRLYPKVKGALSSCIQGYISTVIEWIPFSKDWFNNNNPKLAYQNMTNAALAALRCEAGLKGLGQSPLTNWNDFANKAAIVCASIAGSLM